MINSNTKQSQFVPVLTSLNLLQAALRVTLMGANSNEVESVFQYRRLWIKRAFFRPAGNSLAVRTFRK